MLNEMKRDLEVLASETDLGHSAKNGAFLRQVENMCRNPGGTGSGTSSDMADCISAYRFAENGKHALDELRKTQMKNTAKQCGEDETILVINDVSLLDYYKHESKKDRKSIGDGNGKGYEFVCNLGVGLESESVLGVFHSCLINADGPDDANLVNYHGNPLFEKLSEEDPERLERNHKHILACHCEYLSKTLSDRNVITVADREFDDHFIFEGCAEAGQDFVIRSNALRNVQVSSDYKWLPETGGTMKYPGLPLLPEHICAGMRELVENVPLTPFKKIPLDGKGRLTDERMAKAHAEVSVGAFSVVLYRNAQRNKKYICPKSYCKINVVVVKELDPPEGRSGICWVLYTSLPVDNIENIGKIVRIYELRWLIECFFKYLKSGFKLEDVRYDDAKKTAVHIVVISIAATFIMRLKARTGLAYDSFLSDSDYEKLKRAAKNMNDESIDFDIRLLAYIAKQGGWRGRRRDPISPMTLMRGFDRVMVAVDMIEKVPDLLEELSRRCKLFKNVYNR